MNSWRHINERSPRPHGTIERGEFIIVRWNNLSEMLADFQTAQGVQSDELNASAERISGLEREQGEANQQIASLSAQFGEAVREAGLMDTRINERVSELDAMARSFQLSLAHNIKERIEALSIVFQRNAVLLDRAQAASKVAEVATLMALSDALVEIQGHGDTLGNLDLNDEVALARAEWVRDELIAAGIDPDRISVRSLGIEPDRDGRMLRQVRFRVSTRGSGG